MEKNHCLKEWRRRNKDKLAAYRRSYYQKNKKKPMHTRWNTFVKIGRGTMHTKENGATKTERSEKQGIDSGNIVIVKEKAI